MLFKYIVRKYGPHTPLPDVVWALDLSRYNVSFIQEHHKAPVEIRLRRVDHPASDIIRDRIYGGFHEAEQILLEELKFLFYQY